ncbi:BRCT domain-containing protein [Aeromonas sp. 23P]|uniref:BRCT domain-containing protein n=1 Tax=Aeromonas sp. 23P TaxID=3452716 RepID=UPI003F7AC03B
MADEGMTGVFQDLFGMAEEKFHDPHLELLFSTGKLKIDRELAIEICSGEVGAADLDDEELPLFIEVCEASYRAGHPIISNERFDREFLEELRSRDPEHPLLRRVGEENLSEFEGEEVPHPTPMLSTEKCYTDEEISKWLTQIHASAKKLGINPNEVYVTITPKLDGVAGRKNAGVLCTRGDHFVGVNITRIFGRGVLDLSKPEYEVNGGDVLGEIVMNEQYFKDNLSGAFKHPRNFVVGLIKSDTMNEQAIQACADKVVAFVPYKSLMSVTLKTTELIDRLGEIRADMYKFTPYPLDGLVVEVVNQFIKSDMGAAEDHYRWMRAIKDEGETAIVECIGILRQTGRTGRVTPLAMIPPTELSGCVITKPTAHNERNVLDKGIGVGALLKIVRAGEVIPKIIGVIQRAPVVEEAMTCPSCGSELVWDGAYKVCENKYHCPAQSANAIVHFMKGFGNVKEFGNKSVARIVEAGFNTIDKVFTMTEADYLKIGFGPKETSNFLAEISKATSKPLKDTFFLACFGFRYLGKVEAKKILSRYSLSELGNLTESDLASIKGFGDKKCPSIIKSLHDNAALMQTMMGIGFNIIQTKAASGSGDGESSKEGLKLSGINIVITGEMKTGTRERMKELAEENGANVQSGVSSKTTLLLAGDASGKSKLDKANSLGVRIISEDDFLQMIA